MNLVAAEELARIEGEHGSSAREQAELVEAIARLRGSIGNLNREGRERLRAAFDEVDGHFRVLFTRLFEGGAAHLALVDSDDPLEAGLEIYAQPPGKRLQSLSLLSGGEQALTATALIFALFLTNPAPICVLDEVDAPLDDANVERFLRPARFDGAQHHHALSDCHPQRGDDEPDAPLVRGDDGRKRRVAAGQRRFGRGGFAGSGIARPHASSAAASRARIAFSAAIVSAVSGPSFTISRTPGLSRRFCSSAAIPGPAILAPAVEIRLARCAQHRLGGLSAYKPSRFTSRSIVSTMAISLGR